MANTNRPAPAEPLHHANKVVQPPPAPPAPPEETPPPDAKPPADEDELLQPGEDPDDAFFSSVPGKGVVTRHGGGNSYIGAVRDPKAEGGIRYTPDVVVMVPGADMRRYSREYGRAVRDGALRERKRGEYRKQARDERELIERKQKEKREKLAAAAAGAPAAATDGTKTTAPRDPASTGG